MLSEDDLPVLAEVDEYDGEPRIAVAATQLDCEVSRSSAARIVQDWCDYFAAGPSPITELEFVTRTPKRLFASLRGQTQLRRLVVKWGDYDDLGALSSMTHLEHLSLGSATAVRDLAPLTTLGGLRRLTLEGTRRVHDYSPLGGLQDIEHLVVVESINGPRQHADSIAFLAGLKRLQYLCFSPIVDDHDFSAVLALDHVETIVLHPQRNMHPAWADLEWASPGIQRHQRELAAHVIPVWDDETDRRLGEYRYDVDGRTRFYED